MGSRLDRVIESRRVSRLLRICWMLRKKMTLSIIQFYRHFIQLRKLRKTEGKIKKS